MSETAMTGEIEALVARLTQDLYPGMKEAVCPTYLLHEAAEALSRLNHECAAERERREAAEGEARVHEGNSNDNYRRWAEEREARITAEARALTAEAALAKAPNLDEIQRAISNVVSRDVINFVDAVFDDFRARANGESP